MNKKVLISVISTMILAMLVTPVLAIGPANSADQNPNVILGMVPGVTLLTPSGIDIDWVLSVGPVAQHVMWKDARYFKINNAFVITSLSQLSANEHAWVYFSQEMFYKLMLSRGVPPERAAAFASKVPEGVYRKSASIG